MLLKNNYIIVLFILSLVIFYFYISSEETNFLESLFQFNKQNVVTKNLPEYSNKNNYLDIIDNEKKHLQHEIISHETYNKLIFTDTLLEELNVLMVPIISKINKTLHTRYNKHYIDYKYVEKKQDKRQNTLYLIKVVLFRRGQPQKELIFEIFKGSDHSININNIIDQSNAYKLNFEDKYNQNNIYMNEETNLPIVPQSSLPYQEKSKQTTVESFASRTRDFDDLESRNIKNKNIVDISKYYNLTSQVKYPAIEKNLFNRESTTEDDMDGIYSSSIPNSEINFEVNKYGIQEKAINRNAWFIDGSKQPDMPIIFPQNKVTNKWDSTGTIIESSQKECDIASGVDNACEEREKIPNHHPTLFSYYAKNPFNNKIDKDNMFSLLHEGAAGHTPI